MGGLTITVCKEAECGARIVYVPIRKSDGSLSERPHPFDVEPHKHGAYIIEDGEARRARIYCGHGGDQWNCKALAGEHCCAEDSARALYITHFATCKNPRRFRSRPEHKDTR